jgi:hypothetical protein
MAKVFDAAKGSEARDTALQLVYENAHMLWKAHARVSLILTAAETEFFIVDDVWKRMPEDAPKTHENRAMGAILKWGQKCGYCEPTDEFQPSAQPQCHRNPRRVWKSLKGNCLKIPPEVFECEGCDECEERG